MQWRLNTALDPKYGSIADPLPAEAVPKERITLSTTEPNQEAAKKFNVLIVAYECAQFGLKFGGLGEAVYGQAKSLKEEVIKSLFYCPKFDKLPVELTSKMEEKGTIQHTVSGKLKEDKVWGFEENGIEFRYLEDTNPEDVDHYSVPGPKFIQMGI